MRKNVLFKNKFTYTVMLIVLAGTFILLSHRVHIIRNRQPWIRTKENSIIKDGKPFRFVGANAVNLVFYDNWDLDIEKAIRTAKENNISVLRFYMDWGWSKDEDIDKIIELTSRYGIYVILTLTDCCCSGDYSSITKYFEVHAPFCNITNKQSINVFKKRIKQIIERKNSINGRVYRNDPTILAWELANELEYWHFNESDVYGWIDDIATYIKTLDKNHLVTIGISMHNSEFSNGSPLYRIFNVPTLDFFSFHFYSSSEILNSSNMISREEMYQIEFITNKFLSLGKPVIMGEFGFSNSLDLNSKIRSTQNTADLYNLALKKYMDTAFYAGCSGVIFWGWGVPEEKMVPMWWSQESHSTADRNFCTFLKKYQIPYK